VSKKILFVGAGAIGSYIGAFLSRARHDVTLVDAWAEQVEAIRRQGIYFAMITFALAQIVYFYAVQARWTEGENGIQSVPAGYLFGFIDLKSVYATYYFILALFLFAFAMNPPAH
jgi:ABC-type branched-subunit amino acid transport system permease subunit